MREQTTNKMEQQTMNNESADRGEVIIDMEPLMMAQAQKKNAKKELAETKSIRRIIWMIAIITLAVTALFIGGNNYYYQTSAMQRKLQMEAQSIESQIRSKHEDDPQGMDEEVLGRYRLLIKTKYEHNVTDYLGSGSWASVFEVNGMAMKIEEYNNNNHGDLRKKEELEKEYRIQKQAYEDAGNAVLEIEKQEFWQQELESTSGLSMITMQLARGSMLNHLYHEKKKFRNDQIIRFIDAQVHFLGHFSANHNHLDVNMNNYVIGSDGNLLLIDFGTAMTYEELEDYEGCITTWTSRSGVGEYLNGFPLSQSEDRKAAMGTLRNFMDVNDYVAFVN